MCAPPEAPEPGPFALKVDPEQNWKAEELKIFSFARPHMRAFHCSWWSFFMASFIWFSIAPLLPEIKDSLGLTSKQIWISNIVAISSDIAMRSVFGSLTDKYGSRILMGGVLMAASIPTACTGLVNNIAGLCILRFAIGFAGSTFVMCQAWTTSMFTKDIVGTANALAAGWGGAGAFTQMIIGTALFPLFRDVVFEDTEDPAENAWRHVCIVPALVTFLTGVIIIGTSDDCPQGNYKQLVTEKKMLRRQSSTASFREGAFDINTWILFIHYGCSSGVELTMSNATATYFVDRFNLSIASAAAVTSIFGVVNLFARAIGGFISDWANRKAGMKGSVWVQFTLLFAEGICIIVFALMNSLWSAIMVLCIMSMLTLCSEGSTFGIVPYVTSSSPGSVAGMVGAGGPSLGVLFGLGFVFLENIQHAYFLMGCLVILGATSCLLINIRGHGGIFHKPFIPQSRNAISVNTGSELDV